VQVIKDTHPKFIYAIISLSAAQSAAICIGNKSTTSSDRRKHNTLTLS